jgi:hypothetical protein
VRAAGLGHEIGSNEFRSAVSVRSRAEGYDAPASEKEWESFERFLIHMARPDEDSEPKPTPALIATPTIPAECLYDGSSWQPILTCSVSHPTRTLSTAYQPNTSRPTMVTAYVLADSEGAFAALMDSSPSPTTDVASQTVATGANASITFIVPPASYYILDLFGGSATSLHTTEWTL